MGTLPLTDTTPPRRSSKVKALPPLKGTKHSPIVQFAVTFEEFERLSVGAAADGIAFAGYVRVLMREALAARAEAKVARRSDPQRVGMRDVVPVIAVSMLAAAIVLGVLLWVQP